MASKLIKLGYVQFVPVVYQAIDRSTFKKGTPKPPPAPKPVPPPVSEAFREAEKERFLSIVKRAAKLSKRHGHYVSHSAALDGIAYRLRAGNYAGLNSLLDLAHPDKYPWSEAIEIKDDLLEVSSVVYH